MKTHSPHVTPPEVPMRGEETIHYALRRCSLGLALIAVSEKGVCAILLGDDAEALREDLRRRFKKALLIEDADGGALVGAAIAMIETPDIHVGFPIDARGTDFQKRVWTALRAIPPGQTTSYAEIARRIGSPKATRAVGSAIAANPVAVAVPCHRVLRSDGALSGYHWGADRKRALLAREKALLPRHVA
ncbi:methylated-DNA--[protein]-cysteine S-methyltransferase [Methylocystis sp. MJC1]|jgi:AraC family transcriptional regulator of adaptative response/methylated-DNA-[protein]-cysteine methyltransferase|uniref:methylated-DNA--[protein]-cysteine S-methyltransferase n=1 Tax=Methylocystis sp. MJC1 TaxID=2654282 RepID=UPI001FEFDF1E|nr:methylated-DNA--[protein]-cysteine S-methyltransferase [Methylocystis sp. MJC1]UZX12575.1 methylated-DNA--[protein]-cysteine S-methyltransferase [Methylocystis sp. MJC1]